MQLASTCLARVQPARDLKHPKSIINEKDIVTSRIKKICIGKQTWRTESTCKDLVKHTIKEIRSPPMNWKEALLSASTPH